MLTGAAMFTAYVKVAVFGVPLLSDTLMVMFAAPAAVGVPFKTPPVVMLRPAGNAGERQVRGAMPPGGCGRREPSEIPTTKLCRDGVVIVITESRPFKVMAAGAKAT